MDFDIANNFQNDTILIITGSGQFCITHQPGGTIQKYNFFAIV